MNEFIGPWDWGIGDTGSAAVPIGPAVHFEVQEVTFKSLTRELVALEQKRGISSLELFRRFYEGELGHDDPELEDWLSTFLMYLGASEIQQYACR